VGRDTGRNRNYVQMIGVLLWGTPHDPLRWCVVALPLGKLFLIGRLPTGTTGTFICEALRVLLPPPATRARPLSADHSWRAGGRHHGFSAAVIVFVGAAIRRRVY